MLIQHLWIGTILTIPLFVFHAGITTYLTTESTSVDRDPSVYMISMGACCLFFVVWHIVALLTGVYQKAQDSRSKLGASWCLRICHCGFFAWLIALGVVSYLIWPDFSFSNLTITYYVMLSFVGCQYLMFLYCIIECCVDIFLCIDDTNTS